jgi:hypothetical protein
VSDIGAGFATGWNHVSVTFGLYPSISKFVLLSFIIMEQQVTLNKQVELVIFLQNV